MSRTRLYCFRIASNLSIIVLKIASQKIETNCLDAGNEVRAFSIICIKD